MAEASYFKFGAHLGFAKTHQKPHQRKSRRSLGLGKLPNIWGSPLIFLQRPRCPLSVSGASCFKTDSTLVYASMTKNLQASLSIPGIIFLHEQFLQREADMLVPSSAVLGTYRIVILSVVRLSHACFVSFMITKHTANMLIPHDMKG